MLNLSRKIPSTYMPGTCSQAILEQAKKAIRVTPNKAYVKRTRLDFNHAIYYNNSGYAYCSYCDKEIPVKAFSHGGKSKCPICKQERQTFSITRYKNGKAFFNYAHVTHLQKGRTKGSLCEVLTEFRHYIMLINGKVKQHFSSVPLSVLVVLPDNHRVRFKAVDDGFQKNNRVCFTTTASMMGNVYLGNWSLDVPRAVVRNTPLEQYYDLIPKERRSAFTLTIMTEDVEKLYKAGLPNLAYSLLQEYSYQMTQERNRVTLDTLPQGPAHKMLGLTPAYFKILRESSGTKEELRSLKRLSDERFPSDWIAGNVTDLESLYHHITELLRLRVNVRRVLKDYGEHLGEYIDYVKALREVGEYADENKYLYPKDLIPAHDAMIKKLTEYRNKNEIEKQAGIDKKIQRFAKMLSLFTYSDGKYIIRPLRSVLEMYEESRLMSHCIKTYTKRYGERRCSLFTVRTEDSPDHPIVSVEIRHDDTGWFMVQARAKQNAAPTTEIKEFLNKWLNHIRELSLKEENKKTVAKLFRHAA